MKTSPCLMLPSQFFPVHLSWFNLIGSLRCAKWITATTEDPDVVQPDPAVLPTVQVVAVNLREAPDKLPHAAHCIIQSPSWQLEGNQSSRKPLPPSDASPNQTLGHISHCSRPLSLFPIHCCYCAQTSGLFHFLIFTTHLISRVGYRGSRRKPLNTPVEKW